MGDIAPQDEFYFQWHITERCNWRCSHCYQTGLPSRELEQSDLALILHRMDVALTKWAKIGSLSLTGGEPFLRKADLWFLMTAADATDSIGYYDILTNGSLIGEEEASALTALKKLRRVQVSLEGASASTNDRIRGDGAFNKTVAAIRLLKSQGLAVSVMTTLSRLNAHEVPDLVRMLNSEGVDTCALERLIPEGTGAGMHEHMLTKEELKALYERVYRLALETKPLRVLLYRPLFALVAPDDPTVGALCSSGNNALTIMPDGTVYPCRRLPIPLGNVLEEGFFKIWYGSDVLWRIRDPQNLGGKCRGCDLVAQCRGCRAMAYFMTGDYMAEEPQCWR